MRFSSPMKIYLAIFNIAAFLFIVLFISTLWAINKSRERTECYRRAESQEQCEQPMAYERFIRAISG